MLHLSAQFQSNRIVKEAKQNILKKDHYSVEKLEYDCSKTNIVVKEKTIN